MERTKSSYRWHAIKVIQRRESRRKFWRLGAFLVTTLTFFIASVLLINAINFTETNILLIEEAPFKAPLIVYGLLMGLYFALVSLINTSREFTSGTLELLLCGPVDELSFILGEFLAQMKIYTLALGVFLSWYVGCAWLLNFALQWDMLAYSLTTLFTTAELIALGQVTAIWGKKARAALIYFILILSVLAGIQLADSIVSNLIQVNSDLVNDPMLFVRDTLTTLTQIIQWFSPFALLQNAFRAISDQSLGAYALNISLGLSEAGALLGASIYFLSKKGVRE
jgi:ABC-type transport system involved in multi-copper enzyme maturation permease subunit